MDEPKEKYPIRRIRNALVSAFNFFSDDDIPSKAKVNAAASILLPTTLINVSSKLITGEGEDITTEDAVQAGVEFVGVVAAIATAGESKVTKFADDIDDFVGPVRKSTSMPDFVPSAKPVSTKSKSRGRSGKQARLREWMNDPKASSADRGWLRNDARHIKTGNKNAFRIPRNGRKSPGRKAADKGYELAHRNNAPASSGQSYKGSIVKNHAEHKVETRIHAHRYRK